MTPLSPLELDTWLDNWSRWANGYNGGPAGYSTSPIAAMYVSRESGHHEPPRAIEYREPPHTDAAQHVEIRVRRLPPEHAHAIRAMAITFPAARLLALHVKRNRWDGIRARYARQTLPEYQTHVANACNALAASLAPWRHLL